MNTASRATSIAHAPAPKVEGRVAYAVATIEGLGFADAVADHDALEALDVVETVNGQQTAYLEAAVRELNRARKALKLARSTPSNRAQFERDAEAQMDLVLGLLHRAREAGENEQSPLRYASRRVRVSREQALGIVADCESLLTGRSCE